jgi:hypothetical protein
MLRFALLPAIRSAIDPVVDVHIADLGASDFDSTVTRRDVGAGSDGA